MAIAKDSAVLPFPGTTHQVGSTTYLHNSFEAHPGLLAKTQMVTLPASGLTYPPAGGWTWAGGGIAGTHSAITAGTAPSGDFAAFLQSTTTTGPVGVSIPFAVPGPVGRTWRLDFRGALRWRYGLEGDDHQILRVSVSMVTGAGTVTEIVFDETLRDDAYRTYLTRPFVAVASSVTVTFQGMVQEAIPQTALIDQVEIREVLPWSSWDTWWGGVVPSGGTPVSIPVTSCVGVATGAADTIDLMGELIALESSQGVLSTRLLHVHGPGSRFQVGSEGLPYLGEFQVVLDDDQIGSNEMINALMVDDGAEIAMHGRKCTSWLRLTTTVAPNESLIKLDAMPVGWRVGDTIVIAASNRDFKQAERRSITAIAAGTPGAQVTLSAPLTYGHCGVAQPVEGPVGIVTLDQRAEVGLLTHNVKVIGAPRSTMSVPRLGGHIMIKGGPNLANPGFGRFTGIELVNLGREGQRGRYPMHWHMLLGGGLGQYMKSCSIRDSNLRVVSVHGTDHIVFEDNVAHEHFGHGVFLEDASEQWCVFRNNLVLGTRRPQGPHVLPSDVEPLNTFQNRAPATFWITNPHNTFVGNVAAGGEGVGYWFVFPSDRMRESKDPPAFNYFATRPMPHDQVLIEFDDNSCHSTYMAFDVHDGIILVSGADFEKIKTNHTWKPQIAGVRQTATISRFTAYSCNVGIYTGDGDTSIAFDRTMVADTTRALAFASHDIVCNSIVVRDSGNGLRTPLVPPFDTDVTSALLLYDGAARLEGVRAVGFHAGGGQNVSLFNGVGAARRRTGVSIDGLTSSPYLMGGSLSAPFIKWQDFADPNPPSSFLVTDQKTHPHVWAFTIANPDLGLGRWPGITHPSVVGNHPMMLFQPYDPAAPGGSYLEYPLPNVGTGATSGKPLAWSSPYRFGFLRVFCEGVSGSPPQLPPAPQYPPSAQFVLRYTRERLAGGSTQSHTYTDYWLTDFYKQMAVVLAAPSQANQVRYKLFWSDPAVAGSLVPTTELRLGEMQLGESALIGIEGCAVTPLPAAVEIARGMQGARDDTATNWVGLPSFLSMDDLVGHASSGYFADMVSGTLWLRIVASPSGAHSAIVLVNDGLGQVVRVRR